MSSSGSLCRHPPKLASNAALDPDDHETQYVVCLSVDSENCDRLQSHMRQRQVKAAVSPSKRTDEPMTLSEQHYSL